LFPIFSKNFRSIISNLLKAIYLIVLAVAKIENLFLINKLKMKSFSLNVFPKKNHINILKNFALKAVAKI